MLHVRAGDIEYKGIYRGKLFIQLLRNEETPSDHFNTDFYMMTDENDIIITAIFQEVTAC